MGLEALVVMVVDRFLHHIRKMIVTHRRRHTPIASLASRAFRGIVFAHCQRKTVRALAIAFEPLSSLGFGYRLNTQVQIPSDAPK
jgi:hypothetical protein